MNYLLYQNNNFKLQRPFQSSSPSLPPINVLSLFAPLSRSGCKGTTLFSISKFFCKNFKTFFQAAFHTLNNFPLLSRRECKDKSLFLIPKLFWKKITRIFCPSILQPPLYCSFDQKCLRKGRTLIEFYKLLGIYFHSFI